MTYKTSISITNSCDKEITFHLEPWGQQFSMPAGCTLQIVGESKEQGELEIEYKEDNILAYGWAGSILTVYCDGQDISS